MANRLTGLDLMHACDEAPQPGVGGHYRFDSLGAFPVHMQCSILHKRGTLGPDGQRVVSAGEAQRFQLGEPGQQRPEGGVHQLRLHFVEALQDIAANQLSR